MKFSLIICTYMRSESLLKLLDSIQKQLLYPDEILIIDGSLNRETEARINASQFKKLKYFLVSDEYRGLTKQRNFGVSKVDVDSEVVCFVDDDTTLEQDYFFEIIKSFQENKDVVGVGGVAVNEYKWKLQKTNIAYHKKRYYLFEGYFYKEGLRNVIRNYFNLSSHLAPGKMPNYSHGRTCGFPMTGKTYNVDLLIGMSMAFRKSIFDKIKFSVFFEGYGLYEDADFSLRALQYGNNVVNTKVRLSHFHVESGRPNQYQYGKMVVRNGWYVWRIKNPDPIWNDKIKWHSITVLLTIIRFSNVFSTSKSKEAFTEALGRMVGWWSLFFDKPKLSK